MKKLYFYLTIFLFISSCSVINKSNIADSELFSINEESVLADEFLYVYVKNNFNNDSIYTEKDVDEYFNLFVNFKLKVAEAKSDGLDTTEAFINEFETYKNQLIKPYLTETKEQEKLVKEAYELMKYEIDASHILVSVSPDALAEDTTKAYQKILEAYEKAKSGLDFGELALTYSEDPSAKTNKGRLGYFTAFQMVYQFEDAAYQTPVDSISNILRSRFGYHVLKVHDKRPYSGKVKVSHIMLSTTGDQDATQRNKIFEIHEQIIGGADWDEMCLKYSDDQRTKKKGGTLPFIGLRQINDSAFENVAFNLQKSGQISDPVKSKFGWHIIRLEEKIGLEPFDEIKEELEQKVSKDDRSKLSRQSVISNLKAQNNYIENSLIRNQLVQLADSSILTGKWESNYDSIANETLFTIEGRQYKINLAIEEISNLQKRRTGITPQQYMSELIDNYTEKCLFDYEEEQLLNNNRDFRLLLNEYYEGILLFEIMNQKVWGKAVEDTLELQSYFEKNQDSYYWGQRIDAAILSTSDKNTFNAAKKRVRDESYKLYEIDIDINQEFDVVANQELDSMINLFKKYDNSTIYLRSGKTSSTSSVYKKINQHFINMGIQSEALVELQDTLNYKIGIKLNSKSKKSLEYLYNRESALNLHVVEQLFEKGDNELVDSLSWEIGNYELEASGSYYIVLINDILDKQPKKLKDVKGLVISDYQDYLEKIWLTDLKNKFAVSINELTLDKIKSAYRKKLNALD